MDLDSFEAELAGILGRPSELRPFVCEGSPVECDVFIVGYNPATRMAGDWWQFWDKGYGFRKSLWLPQYLAGREGKASKTRVRIDAIVRELGDVRVLEANIDARPSATQAEYPKPLTAPFDFLLKTCSPKVIIAHGKPAVAHIRAAGTSARLIECAHFIYGGHRRSAEIVAETKAALAI